MIGPNVIEYGSLELIYGWTQSEKIHCKSVERKLTSESRGEKLFLFFKIELPRMTGLEMTDFEALKCQFDLIWTIICLIFLITRKLQI